MKILWMVGLAAFSLALMGCSGSEPEPATPESKKPVVQDMEIEAPEEKLPTF